jgi:hypothetical protein
MAQLPQSPNQDMMNDFELMPACRVVGMMHKSEWKPTKDKAGTFLECEFKITRGMFVGKTLVSRLNLANKNPVAVEMSFKELNTIKAACQMPGAMDSEELHGVEMLLKLGIDLPKPGSSYGPSNTIKMYSVFDGQTVPPDPTDEEIALTKRLSIPTPIGAGPSGSGFVPPSPGLPQGMPSLGGQVPPAPPVPPMPQAPAPPAQGVAPGAVKMPWEM